MNEIRFYKTKETYGFLSNFYRKPVKMKGLDWQTSEHFFQAQKFSRTPHEDEVRMAESPHKAAEMGRDRSRPLRSDWEQVKDQIMYEVLVAKFTQHKDLRKKLLATGDAQLIEHTTNDFYWADGGDGTGKNILGKILMRVRKELKAAQP